MLKHRSHILLAVALVLPATLIPSATHAQYFGQNKVRYKTYDFKILHTSHFDVYYYLEEKAAAEQLARMAERWYTRHSKVLNWQLLGRQPVIVYASGQDFRSTTVIPDFIGESTGGVTEALRRRIVMPMAGPLAETDHVLGHELVHAFQYDITSRVGPGGVPGAAALPLWFIEGMAEYLSLGPVDPHTAMWMRDAVRQKKVPKIKDLDNPKYFPYRWGQAFWAYVGGRYGDQAIGQLLRAAGRGGQLDSAIQSVLRISTDELSRQWQRALADQYEPVLQVSSPPTENAKLLVSQKQHGGELNVSPALSPDGTQMVFFSSKGLFSIDLFVADARTGEIKRKPTKSAVDPHIDSLEFVNSAGAWSADSKFFAYGTISGGRPELDIYDVANGKMSRKIRLRELDEIYNPTWSPDGQRIAFSANVGGVTDLFVVDVKSKQVRRLTNDAFADLQPAWSPDGSRIAFVTDRFSSDLGELAFGHYQIGLIDPDGSNIQPVRAFDTGKHTNPQWSADGRSLYFISDHSGKSDIYRIALANGAITQVTNLQTGVSGITSLSPAFSVAGKADRMVYSAYLADDYNIYGVDSPQVLAGAPPAENVARLGAGVLPPRERAAETVATLLKQPETGLVSQTNFRSTDYKAKLGLDYVAPVGVGIGYSSFGSMISGGTALSFSDMLGFHNLVLGLQTSTVGDAGNFFRNFAGTVTYLNQKSRWNWGFTGGQVPYLTGDLAQGVVDLGNGQLGLAQQEVTFWQIDRQFAGILQYPFSRAQRIEFTGGYQNIAFAGENRIDVFDPVTGQLLATSKQDIETPSALNMGVFSSALVYDTSIFGGTSPILGQSYRFEVGGTAGSLNFGTLLLDYRRYVKLGPVTLAGRGLHYGRYGGDSEDPRLSDLFLGYDSLVRGYDPGSIDVSECGPQVTTTGTCPVFDRLVGSRIAVGNAELRLPVLGALGVIPSRSFPPVEVAPFFDVGVAWSRSQKPSFLSPAFGSSRETGRDPVSSYGVSFRVNLLGFAIGQISLAHPNERPMKNWVWQFSLLPGF